MLPKLLCKKINSSNLLLRFFKSVVAWMYYIRFTESYFPVFRSPSFCEADPKTESAGTSGRVCRIGRTSRSGSCDLLCCGRGHALIRKSSIKPCNCTFHWCCRVDCQRCRDDKWVAVCKWEQDGKSKVFNRRVGVERCQSKISNGQGESGPSLSPLDLSVNSTSLYW